MARSSRNKKETPPSVPGWNTEAAKAMGWDKPLPEVEDKVEKKTVLELIKEARRLNQTSMVTHVNRILDEVIQCLEN